MTADALLILDMQTDLLDANGRFPVCQNQVVGLIAAANTAAAAAEAHGVPVVYICNVFHPWDPGNLFRGGCCVRGRAGVELDARVLQLEHAESFNKWRGDAFCNEALARWLSEGGVRSVAVAGVYANACVQATVSGALKRGLQVTVLTDAVAAGSDGARRKGLENMQSAGARLSSVANWTTKDVS